MVSSFDPVGVETDDPLGGFDRLDEGFPHEAVVVDLKGVLLDLVVGFAQDAISIRAVGILPDKSPGDRHDPGDRCAGVVDSAVLPMPRSVKKRVVKNDAHRLRDHGIREAQLRTLVSESP